MEEPASSCERSLKLTATIRVPSGSRPPNPADYPADEADLHYTHGNVLSVSRDQVAENFRSYDLLDDRLRFLVGWFRDTLPTAPIDSLAILRLDGDMYESTIQALSALYDKLSPGGYVIVDDYFLKPCAKANPRLQARARN